MYLKLKEDKQGSRPGTVIVLIPALAIYRFLEKKLESKYTCGELLKSLKAMNYVEVQEQKFMTIYRQKTVTDDLYEVCGFRTDYPRRTKYHRVTKTGAIDLFSKSLPP